MGVLAGAGLTMALSQLFGGWTKWGMPRISAGVFLIGFLPVLVAAGWVILAGQPDANWFQRHVTSWSSSISIDGLVDDLRTMLPVLAFGVGLVFGFTFDTTGPKKAGEPLWESSAPPAPADTPRPSRPWNRLTRTRRRPSRSPSRRPRGSTSTRLRDSAGPVAGR